MRSPSDILTRDRISTRRTAAFRQALHGVGNCFAGLLQPAYVPIREACYRSDVRLPSVPAGRTKDYDIDHEDLFIEASTVRWRA